MKKIRVRFAPSPTGGLHLGGIRTALFNYAFAKKNGGDFILRIEDTDGKRFNKDAENQIKESLEWLGIHPDESPWVGGPYGPYRQSERKYEEYAIRLVKEGFAYRAYDTEAELTAVRETAKANGTVFTYNATTRMSMHNSLSTIQSSDDKYVIRLKADSAVKFTDIVRDEVEFSADAVDDKILFKSDGTPTYHLANVVDDHLMEITHVIRGEEWLPSTPIHLILYAAFGWEPPVFAHLPLVLNPDGNGKLSKRTAMKLGFSVFAVNWDEIDFETNELQHMDGFREMGFEKEGLLNYLMLLGWHNETEILSKEEFINLFSLEKVGSAGVRFNYDKLVNLNMQWLKKNPIPNTLVINVCRELLNVENFDWAYNAAIERAIFQKDLDKTLIPFIQEPAKYITTWNEASASAWPEFIMMCEDGIFNGCWTNDKIAEVIQIACSLAGVKKGMAMSGLRAAITGGVPGPDLITTVRIIGMEKTVSRLNAAIEYFDLEGYE